MFDIYYLSLYHLSVYLSIHPSIQFCISENSDTKDELNIEILA